MSKFNSILIMAGGTGGHVFPGLAVAKHLQEQGIIVNWLGTQKGLEAKLVPEAGIPLHYISIGGLRGKSFKELIVAPWRLTKAIIQSIKLIKKLNPDVILGMGGFVSGPGGIASWLLRRPLVIHEQNAKVGTTNKWLAFVAKKTLEGFPNTFIQREKTITTGNPVRAEIINLPPPTERFKNRTPPLNLLVIGGSLGATVLNQVVPAALAKLPPEARPVVYHQTGEKLYSETSDTYKKLGVAAEVIPFITNMANVYAQADIVLCRAGALTVAELCAAGLGAILIPFPWAIDDHQTANASYMVENKAALLIPQKDLTQDRLLKVIKELYDHREKCFLMAQFAYDSRKINATEHVSKICEEIASELDI